MAEGESYRALEVENSKPNEVEEEEGEEEEEEESVGDEDDDEEEQRGRGGRFESELGKLQSSEPANEAKFRDTQLKALVEPSSVEVSENGVQVNSTSHSIDETQSEKQNGMLHHEEQEVLETGVAQVAETQAENKHQLTLYPTTSQDMSPISVTQSVSHAASPTLQEKVNTSGVPEANQLDSSTYKKLNTSGVPEANQLDSSTYKKLNTSGVPEANQLDSSTYKKLNTSGVPEANQLDSSTHKKVSPITVMKTSTSDGYNWRKYGQKQVKSPKGSRSYYRCTYSDCYAKKIECCDHLSHVTEIVYKSPHTHEPPIMSACTKRSKHTSSAQQVLAHCLEENPSVTRNDLDPSTSLKHPLRETPALPERKRQNSINSDDCGDNHIKEEQVNEPEPKRRVKESNLDYSGLVTKAGKKTKLVVHAAGDVGISGDGYRWRKYGQKMVKGNPHPRNYYRCTSAGCPVRKHIETATDNTNAVIITYKGIHDHDMPVPKKRHGPHSATLVAAAAPASMKNLLLKKTDPLQSKVTSTQWSVDNDGELTGEAMELGGEKAIESARTLLSIGFEIKPC